MDLAEILTSMTQEHGLSAALIVGRDGLLVEGQSSDSTVDLESLGAIATRTLADLDRIGKEVHGDNLTQIRARFGRYYLVIEPLTESDVLVAGLAGPVDGQRLLDGIAAYRKPVLQALNDL